MECSYMRSRTNLELFVTCRPVPTISRTALPVVRGGKQLGEGASRLFGAKK